MTTAPDFTYGIFLKDEDGQCSALGFNSDELARWLRTPVSFDECTDETFIKVPGLDGVIIVTADAPKNSKLLALAGEAPDTVPHPWTTWVSPEDTGGVFAGLDEGNRFEGFDY